MAWIRVCMTTIYGGLGIIDLEKFSRALRLRWLWYAWDHRARPWKGMDLPVDKDDIALFNAATRVILGNGERAMFWTSRWLQGETPATLYPALFKHSTRKNRTVKEALTDNRWVRDVDHSMTVRIIAEFVAFWGRLQNVVLLPLQEDRMFGYIL